MDKAMQRALMMDAQKLEAMGNPQPLEFDGVDLATPCPFPVRYKIGDCCGCDPCVMQSVPTPETVR